MIPPILPPTIGPTETRGNGLDVGLLGGSNDDGTGSSRGGIMVAVPDAVDCKPAVLDSAVHTFDVGRFALVNGNPGVVDASETGRVGITPRLSKEGMYVI